jgi:hypothetical protein
VAKAKGNFILLLLIPAASKQPSVSGDGSVRLGKSSVKAFGKAYLKPSMKRVFIFRVSQKTQLFMSVRS